MTKTSILLLCSGLALTGCGQIAAVSGIANSQLEQFGEQFRSTMGQVYDRAWSFNCRDAPIETVRQKHATPEAMAAYEAYCFNPPRQPVVVPKAVAAAPVAAPVPVVAVTPTP